MICEPIYNMMSRDPLQDRREIDKFLTKQPEDKYIPWDIMPHALTGGIIWACGYMKRYHPDDIIPKYGDMFDYEQSPDFFICKRKFDDGSYAYHLVDYEYGKTHRNENFKYWGIKKSSKWR